MTKINRMASTQLTVENNTDFGIPITTSLKYLFRTYDDVIPTTVVIGTKGSEKTFLCRRMCDVMGWTAFCKSIEEPTGTSAIGLFLPVVIFRNTGQLIKILQKYTDNINEKIFGCKVGKEVLSDNSIKIEREEGQIIDWLSFWEHLLASSVDLQLTTLQEVNQVLKVEDQKIILLIDGLESTLTHISTDKNKQSIIRAPCQDVVAQMIAKYPHLGIIVSVRRDTAFSAVDVNFKQPHQASGQVGLKWPSNEALRLVVWLVSKAGPKFCEDIHKINQVSQNVIEDVLEGLWGKKLGKTPSNEAYSSRWILTALSDFSGQLQTRDIIRFLKCTSEPPTKKINYEDRITIPLEIRTAVPACSIKEVEEVEQEYMTFKPILEKLEKLSLEHKVLPLLPEYAGLGSEDELYMIREGYLERDGGKSYLLKIIRHASGFKYKKGARPKVLALVLKS